jgi:lipopolysaccharide export system permease protein
VARLDRYVLSQLVVLFGFFALVLVAVFWINRAVVLFDRLIGDGQTALVFLEFTALGLPKLIATVLPLATFAASVYVTNRLNNESEMTVMLATGSSPWRLARPVMVFGLISALMMSILTHVLVPTAQAQLGERESDVSQNITARLLTEGTFLNPTDGVTFYTRAIDDDGVLRDVFLSDRRDAQERQTYTASEAYLVRNGDGTTLIMVDGLAQRLRTSDMTLSTAKFADFSFDISALVSGKDQKTMSIRNMRTWALLGNWDAISKDANASRGQIAEELHSRLAQPLFCIVAALIGFSTLLIGGFSRFGVWREVVIAFALLIFIDGIRSSLSDTVIKDASLWAVLYVPAFIGASLVTGMLFTAANPRWWYLRRRKASA